MYYDGTPVIYPENRRIQLQKRIMYEQGGGGVADQPEEKTPVDGVARFEVQIGPGASSVELLVRKLLV